MEAEIYDFKTSDIKSQEEADDRTKKSTQLATYALSWQELSGELPKSVHLYFIETGLLGTYIPSQKDTQKTKVEIEEATRGIRKREFGATPSMFVCKYCPFKYYCPAAILEKTSS
jgi:CRISPR/Cas system-associated exonuclease Cas4 (RecB family)